MKLRRQFVRAHERTDWGKVVFTDEKKFARYAKLNNQNDVVWASSSSAVPGYEVLQHGPEVMVWGGMCARGVIPLVRIRGHLNSEQYIRIVCVQEESSHWYVSGVT